ncbi:hypothetical protein JTE90_025560 [Oedothorax gibbosus]|uniref:Uncharacterized protein n=1 Tax=Oedothorax gibbosus TaxID=931172 RepID=A0AAV6TXA8_9ARAC|nr:hypothetical protein JTE90_025560 [Oedothorax gibbosus]
MSRKRGYTVVPAIEDVLGHPQQPLADLYNRPRNAGPNFPGPLITGQRTTDGEENEPPEPPTRPATPDVHLVHLHDPLLGIVEADSDMSLPSTVPNSPLIPVNVVHPYNPFADPLGSPVDMDDDSLASSTTGLPSTVHYYDDAYYGYPSDDSLPLPMCGEDAGFSPMSPTYSEMYSNNYPPNNKEPFSIAADAFDGNAMSLPSLPSTRPTSPAMPVCVVRPLDPLPECRTESFHRFSYHPRV